LALTEYFAPILAAGGPAALLFIALRFGALDALTRLLASVTAILSSNKEERPKTALAVLRILSGKDAPPESSPKTAEVSPRDDDASSS
jgi:hypothetical protein